MHQLQRSWVRSQHPSAQWNLRGGRWSSAEYCTEQKEKKSPKKILKKKKVCFLTNNNEHHQIKRERCVEVLIQRKCSNNNLDSAEKINYLSSDVQVVKMMLMVVIIFCVCWLPYHTYFIGKKSWNLFSKNMLGIFAVLPHKWWIL